MKENWQGLISDPDEKKVFSALEDPNWDFRTVHGLTSATGLDDKKIEIILEKYPSLVHKSPIKDNSGQELYALSSRNPSWTVLLNTLRSYIAKDI